MAKIPRTSIGRNNWNSTLDDVEQARQDYMDMDVHSVFEKHGIREKPDSLATRTQWITPQYFISTGCNLLDQSTYLQSIDDFNEHVVARSEELVNLSQQKVFGLSVLKNLSVRQEILRLSVQGFTVDTNAESVGRLMIPLKWIEQTSVGWTRQWLQQRAQISNLYGDDPLSSPVLSDLPDAPQILERNGFVYDLKANVHVFNFQTIANDLRIRILRHLSGLPSIESIITPFEEAGHEVVLSECGVMVVSDKESVSQPNTFGNPPPWKCMFHVDLHFQFETSFQVGLHFKWISISRNYSFQVTTHFELPLISSYHSFQVTTHFKFDAMFQTNSVATVGKAGVNLLY